MSVYFLNRMGTKDGDPIKVIMDSDQLVKLMELAQRCANTDDAEEAEGLSRQMYEEAGGNPGLAYQICQAVMAVSR